MADIAKVKEQVAKSEEIVDVSIFQPDGSPYLGANGTQATIGVLGPESKKHQQARDTLTRKLMRAHGRKMEPADLRANRIEQAAAVVVRWSGWEADGKDWPCAPENVKALLATDHILTQVEDGITRHADFFALSSSS